MTAQAARPDSGADERGGHRPDGLRRNPSARRQHGGRSLVRAAAPSGMSWAAIGWEQVIPRVGEGESLLIGNLRRSRVTRVEVLPA